MTSFIVHIGDGKCGSTSIQKALYDARNQLRTHGIVYETTSAKTGHFDLVTLAGGVTRGNMEKQRVSALETLELIKSKTTPTSTVLLTAESFFMQSPKTILSILELLAQPIERIDVISYVRTPASMYLSLVQQTLKGNSDYTRPDKFTRPIDQKLKQWLDSPIKNSLTVRLFERSRLVDEDAVSDFEKILRRLLGTEAIKLSAQEQNTSISSEQLILLQKLRKIYLKHEDGKLNPMSNRLIQFFERVNQNGVLGNKLELSDAAHQAVVVGNAQIVSKLNDMFPSLGMPNPEHTQTGRTRTDWAHTDDVSAILKTWYSGIVDELEYLTPPLNMSLFDGFKQPARTALAKIRGRFPDSSDLINENVHRYWRQEGCITAANELETLL